MGTRRKRILAVDPGEQTGWATGALTPEGSFEFENCGYTDWRTFVQQYYNVMHGDNPYDIVVYESWRLRAPNAKQMVGSDFPSSQAIGAIKLCAWVKKSKLVTSEPSNKPVVDAQMGGKDYLPKRDGAEHARDTVRHLYWYVINKEGIDIKQVRQEVCV